jgi:hypothetical protein
LLALVDEYWRVVQQFFSIVGLPTPQAAKIGAASAQRLPGLPDREDGVAEPEVVKDDLYVPGCERQIGRCGMSILRHAVEPGTAAVTRQPRKNNVDDLFFDIRLLKLEGLDQRFGHRASVDVLGG